MEIRRVPLSAIHPYERNPRRNGNAVEAVAESIKQCGYCAPIVADENLVILAGHTRYAALRRIGWKECEICVVPGLTDEQKRKYRLLDNQTNTLATWDWDLLQTELEGLDFGNFDFGFDALMGEDEPPLYMERGERLNKTDRNSEPLPRLQRNVFENFERDFDPILTGKYDIPVMEPTHTTCDKMLRYMDWKEVDDLSEYIAHFYVDDYTFAASWHDPDKYVDRLRQFKAVVQPNYSLYTDFPLALQILSCYRRQWIGAYWQSLGLDVIPCIVWGDERSYDFCFDGLPQGGTVAVSSLGVKKDPAWNGKTGTLFYDGWNEMMKRLNPETILYYGGHMDGLTGNVIEVPPKYMQWEQYRGKKRKKGMRDGHGE